MRTVKRWRVAFVSPCPQKAIRTVEHKARVDSFRVIPQFQAAA